MNLDNMLPLDPSDVVILIDFVLAIAVAGYFIFGGPLFAWTKDRLGWVIFWYSLVTVGLLFLIVWAIAFNQKLDEWARLLLASTFGVGLVFKGNAMRDERRRGRLAAAKHAIPEGSLMSNPTPTLEEVKDATTIWYKAQRVLRTLIQVVIPSFIGFAVVLPLIIEAAGLPVDSSLRLWLLAVAGGVTAVATGLSRIMAIPAVNAFLTKWLNLGSVPRSAIYKSPATGNVIVIADEKAADGSR